MSEDDTNKAHPSIIVIFGVTGDLARRKLLPALYHLAKDDLLDERTVIVGITRQKIDVSALLDDVVLCGQEQHGPCDSAAAQRMRDSVVIHRMDLEEQADYAQLQRKLMSIEKNNKGPMQRLFYLSVPPAAAHGITRHLGVAGLAKGARLLVEKPFGRDLESARELIDTTNQFFTEEQIFRIDHYIAKETVQNILTFRFNNPVFADVWSADHIKQIEISAFERIGIEGRATFYESTGALRDVIQSHLMQLLAIVTMDRPASFTSEDIHTAKLHLLQAIRALRPHEVAQATKRGQYQSYCDEVGNQGSFTETYAEVHLHADTERWRGVPMILRSGKKMPEKKVEVVISFKPKSGTMHENQLIFRIQPNEGIGLHLNVKRPGFGYQDELAAMDFSYANTFDDHGHPDAYERVLMDAIKGDRTLFATSAEVLAAWEALNSVVQAWSQDAHGLKIY